MNENHTNLRDDIARCDGVSFDEDGVIDWREGCESCLRRIAPRGTVVVMMEPPPIIAFECEFLINAEAHASATKEPIA